MSFSVGQLDLTLMILLSAGIQLATMLPLQNASPQAPPPPPKPDAIKLPRVGAGDPVGLHDPSMVAVLSSEKPNCSFSKTGVYGPSTPSDLVS